MFTLVQGGITSVAFFDLGGDVSLLASWFLANGDKDANTGIFTTAF